MHADEKLPTEGALPELCTPKEVAATLRCSLRHVYSLFDRGVLRGPRRRPRRIFRWSVLRYLTDMNRPEEKLPEGCPPAVGAPDQKDGRGSVRSFRHLRL
jgi:Helix-turn-helix domain